MSFRNMFYGLLVLTFSSSVSYASYAEQLQKQHSAWVNQQLTANQAIRDASQKAAAQQAAAQAAEASRQQQMRAAQQRAAQQQAQQWRK